MQQATDSVIEHGASAGTATETRSLKVKQRASMRAGIQNFIHWERENQLQAFFTWLPQELHDTPGVDWTQLPAELMGYCLRTIGNSPDAAHLALAAGTMLSAMNVNSQYKFLQDLNWLLKSLRASGFIQTLDDLKQEQTWHNWAAHQEKTERTRIALSVYTSFTSNYFPRFFCSV